jgi:hypothetical protein
LRDEGLETREMIEQKDIALVYRIVFSATFLVQLDVERLAGICQLPLLAVITRMTGII